MMKLTVKEKEKRKREREWRNCSLYQWVGSRSPEASHAAVLLFHLTAANPCRPCSAAAASRSKRNTRPQAHAGIAPTPDAPSSPVPPRASSAPQHRLSTGAAAAAAPVAPNPMAAKWAQKTVVIPAQRRGCHLITPKVPPALSHPRLLVLAARGPWY